MMGPGHHMNNLCIYIYIEKRDPRKNSRIFLGYFEIRPDFANDTEVFDTPASHKSLARNSANIESTIYTYILKAPCYLSSCM